jgi:hypothetical protein
MAQNQTAVGSWRGRVRSWLENVQYNRQVFGNDLRSAVSRSQQSFPSNWLLRISIEIAKELATKFVRSAIKDAATSLGISLSDGELDLLSELAVAGVTG